MNLFLRFVFFGIIGGYLSISQAAPKRNSSILLLEWESGKNINICSSGGGTCVPLKMPDSVGDVKKVIVKKFVAGPGLSWLAINENEVHLCQLGSSSPSIACTKLAKNFKGLRLNVEHTTYGNDLRWVLNGNIESPDKGKKLSALISSFSKAQPLLAQKLTDGGDTPIHTDLLDGSGDDNDAGGGHGDTGSSGGGDAGQIPIPITPPIPVVIIDGHNDPSEPSLPNNPVTPDPPTPVVIVTAPYPNPDPVNVPWYCEWFNVGCPEVTPATPHDPTPIPPSVPVPIPVTPISSIPQYSEGYENAANDCIETAQNGFDECAVYYKAFGYGTIAGCRQRVQNDRSVCLEKARKDYQIP